MPIKPVTGPPSEESGASVREGACLCGQVRFRASGKAKLFQYCHCSRCRKVTGSVHASIMFLPASGFSWLSGEQLVRQYMLEESKYFGTAFCSECGSSMPWMMNGGETVAVPAGALDGKVDDRPQQNIFCASSADWCLSPTSLPSHDEIPPKKR